VRPWYRLRDVARSTGVDERSLRYLAEAGRVDAHGWPDEPGSHRRWDATALAQLERLGIAVRWPLLDADDGGAFGAFGPNGA
jgi:hypothetical protein